MDVGFLNAQKRFVEEVSEILNNHKLSHAYFIETNGCPNYMDAVLLFLKEIFKGNTNSTNYELINENFDYPEIKLLKAEGKVIKKETILELRKECLEKPVLGTYVVYVIDGADNFNPSSANTLLKFLEEPEESIIGILIANNRYQVIDTLISRCQILSLLPDYESGENFDEVASFVNDIKSGDKNCFLENIERYSWDKEKLIVFLDQVVSYCLKDNCDIMNMSIATAIEEKKAQLKYNVNIKLFLDSLVLELIEVISCIN